MFSRSRWRLTRADVDGRDALVALALLLLMVLSISSKDPDHGQRGADALAYVLAVPLTLPFAVHRRWPMPSLIVTVGAFTAFAIAGYAAYPGISLFAILFGIAAHTDRRRSVIALCVCVVAMLVGLATQPSGVVTSGDKTSSMLAIAVTLPASGRRHLVCRSSPSSSPACATQVSASR